MGKHVILALAILMLAAGGAFALMHLSGRLRASAEALAAADSTIGSLTLRLEAVSRSLDSLRRQTPGLGEYMSAVQLHAAKLWFAAGARNWKLASYEVGELGETMETARGLHEFRNGVDIAGLLRGVEETQVAAVRRTVDGGDLRAFQAAYGTLLTACNGCHRSAGYPFIRVIPPAREPVTSQLWDLGKE